MGRSATAKKKYIYIYIYIYIKIERETVAEHRQNKRMASLKNKTRKKQEQIGGDEKDIKSK